MKIVNRLLLLSSIWLITAHADNLNSLTNNDYWPVKPMPYCKNILVRVGYPIKYKNPDHMKLSYGSGGSEWWYMQFIDVDFSQNYLTLGIPAFNKASCFQNVEIILTDIEQPNKSCSFWVKQGVTAEFKVDNPLEIYNNSMNCYTEEAKLKNYAGQDYYETTLFIKQ